MGARYVNRNLVAVIVASVVVTSLQLTIVSPLRSAGVVIMVVWLWPIVLGLTGVTSLAVMGGVVSGFLFDAQCATPFGLSAIVGGLLGYVSGRLGDEGIGNFGGSAWWTAPVVSALGGFIAPLVFALLATMFDQLQVWHGSVGTMMVVNAIAFGILGYPGNLISHRLIRFSGRLR